MSSSPKCQMVWLHPNTSLIQPLDKVVIRTFKDRYTQFSIERTINVIEENPNRKKKTHHMKVWKGYTTANVIIIIEKAMKTITPKPINSSWRKLGPGIVHDFVKLTNRANEGNR